MIFHVYINYIYDLCIILVDDERSSKEQDALATLCVTDVDTTLHYVNQWIQRYINSSDLCAHMYCTLSYFLSHIFNYTAEYTSCRQHHALNDVQLRYICCNYLVFQAMYVLLSRN